MGHARTDGVHAALCGCVSCTVSASVPLRDGEGTLQHDRVGGDGLELHVVRAGNGPPVILLHGFPEGWRSWRNQIEELAAAGFTVIVPDLRGYGESDQPRDELAYRLRHLVEDVACLVRSSGSRVASIAGHDWGGIVAWAFASAHPELLDRLLILNAPHLGLYSRNLWRSSQFLRSWYLALFRVPWLPERLLAARDFHAIRMLFERGAKPGAFSAADVDEYVRALARPGALTAALAYYRAGTPDELRLAREARTIAETLVIWGERDRALSIRLLDGLEAFAPNLRLHRIPDAGHWVQSEAPEEVNGVMVRFLKSTPTESKR